jgi:hypothetical protein
MSILKGELHGAEAARYASDRLRKVRVNQDSWEVEYIDDTTGEEWLMDYPESELHAGGSPRLRRRGSETSRSGA